MNCPNANSIAIIFDNQNIIDKIGQENMKQCARWLGFIEDANTATVAEKSKFHQISVPRRLNESSEVRALLAPYYYQ